MVFFEVFNQRTEEILTKCDILHRRLNSMRICENATRATPSDAAPAVSAAPAHITVRPHSSLYTPNPLYSTGLVNTVNVALETYLLLMPVNCVSVLILET